MGNVIISGNSLRRAQQVVGGEWVLYYGETVRGSTRCLQAAYAYVATGEIPVLSVD